MEDQLLVLIVLVSTAGIVAQWIAWRLGLPAIVILLVAGFLLGPFARVLQPEEAFGAFLDPAISLAVAIVVLEGGLSLNFSELRASGQSVARIIGLGVPVIWLLGAAAAHYIAGLSWSASTLVGVMLIITGPTVITPLLRQAKLERRTASVLRWEGVVNDAIGATLTVVVLDFLLLRHGAQQIETPLTNVIINLATGALTAAALGIGAAFAVRQMFFGGHAPEFLKAPIVLGIALLIYTLADLVQPETGLIAVSVLGIALANLDLPEIEDLKRFNESISTFLVSGVFIVLTATLDITEFLHLDWRALAFIAAVLLLVRPVGIGLVTMGTDLTWRESLFLGLIAPRGIVVAALAGFVGTRLSGSGYEGAEMITPLIFSIIIITGFGDSFMAGPLSRALGLASEQPPGLLIVGAAPWTVALTKVLTRLGTPVVLSDRSGKALEPAQDLAATVHTGHLLAPEEEDMVLLTEVEYLLAATEDDAFNALVCRRFAADFGQQNVYQVAYADRREAAPRFNREWRGNIIIDQDVTIADLNRRIAEGWRFRAVPVRGQDARDGLQPSGAPRRPVLLIEANGELRFASPETELSVGSKGTLVVFEAPEQPAEADSAAAGQPIPSGGRRSGR